MENDYPYQLTESYKTKGECRRECKGIIRQIEKYEGAGKGYDIRERGGKWAVYTSGELGYAGQVPCDNEDIQGEEVTVLQYRDLLKRVR